MNRSQARSESRGRVRLRIRQRVRGGKERPRLAIFKSGRHIYAQVIDDVSGKTVASASTNEKSSAVKPGGNIAAASAIGELVARRALEMGVTAVVFDRGGYLYHGRVKALAEAARKAGLEF